MPNKSQATQLSFETAVEELETIVCQMESGNLALEQSLGAYKRGSELLQICQKSLAEVEQQVRILNEANILNAFTTNNE